MALLIQSEECQSGNRSETDGEPPVSETLSTVSSPMVSSSPVIERVYRHRLPVRISHWLNVPFLIILIMSGLQIFNAHPALYWGDRSDRDQAVLSIRPMQS